MNNCSMVKLLIKFLVVNYLLQLLDMLKFYARFEINDETGDALTDHDMTLLHYSKITSLQRAAFAKFPDLRMFSLANVASVDTRESLKEHFGALDAQSLKNIACYLNLVPETLEPPFEWHRLDEEFLRELLVIFYSIFIPPYRNFLNKATFFLLNFTRYHVMRDEYLNWRHSMRCHSIQLNPSFGMKTLCPLNTFPGKDVLLCPN